MRARQGSLATVRTLLLRRIPALDALRTYRLADARADLLAGLTVAAVAVPQAMAYGLAAGISPEYGLYTAIIMTAVGAVLDSSRQLINGPTNVISIAVLSALASFPADQKVQGAITLAFLVGTFQTLITLLRLGDLTRYISHSVVIGFTCGASLLLVLDQFRNLVGWSSRGDPHDYFLVRLWHTWTEGGPPHLPTLAIGIGSIVSILLLRVIKQRLRILLLPDLLIVLLGASVLTAVLHLDEQGVKVVGALPKKLPSFQWPHLEFAHVEELSSSALAIATLGLLEALAMAKNIAAVTKQKIDLNQQCLSEGLANLAGSFFQCIPGSGSLTRSAINQQAGAVSQWSGVISAVAVAGIVLTLAPQAQYVPRAALAGILIVTAFGMIDWRGLWFHIRATQFDLVIVVLTGFAAIAISVEFCILIGVVGSFLLAVPRAGRVTLNEFVSDEDGTVRSRGPDDKDPVVPIFGLEGELFFASSIPLEEHFAKIERRAIEGARVVVLRIKRLRNPDAVGLHELGEFLRHMRQRECRVILAGVRPDLLAGLKVTGILDELESTQIFPERQAKGSATVHAIHAAYEYLETRNIGSTESSAPKPLVTHFDD